MAFCRCTRFPYTALPMSASPSLNPDFDPLLLDCSRSEKREKLPWNNKMQNCFNSFIHRFLSFIWLWLWVEWIRGRTAGAVKKMYREGYAVAESPLNKTHARAACWDPSDLYPDPQPVSVYFYFSFWKLEAKHTSFKNISLTEALQCHPVILQTVQMSHLEILCVLLYFYSIIWSNTQCSIVLDSAMLT